MRIPHKKALSLFTLCLVPVSLCIQAKACVQMKNKTHTFSVCINTKSSTMNSDVHQFFQHHQSTKNKAKPGSLPDALVFKTYPFEANEKDKSMALANLPLITLGKPITSACKLLGHVDEIRVLYEPKVYKPKTIGFTYWYIYRRGQTSNLQTDQVIRISTDMKLNITKVDSWGF